MKAADIEGLDCGASALEGAKAVLRARFEEMCAFREKALDFSDIKGVHDMRVASRRLRSALRDFLPLFPNRVPRKRLKRIAAALGDVRDEDVALKVLDELRAKAEGAVIAGIEQLIDERRWRRERARARLEEAIKEPELAELREKFASALQWTLKDSDNQHSESRQGRIKMINFRQAGIKIILLRHAELQQLGESLYRPFEMKPLHRLRIRAKRLRYAIELFAKCGSECFMEFAREVAGLQKSLGELHDCDVWIEDLGVRLCRPDERSSNDDSSAQTPVRAAGIWLLQHFVKERTKHFRDALTRWQQWETTNFSMRLSTCLETASATLEPETSEGADSAAALDEPPAREFTQ